MLSRDQVLHVARLARLELSEDEQRRMSEELTKVLDHIEKIGELGDLADVEPTSHVVEVENALRADEPRPSLPVERALESAPDAALGGARVGVKALFGRGGAPTQPGSRTLGGYRPPYPAPAVERRVEGGARV